MHHMLYEAVLVHHQLGAASSRPDSDVGGCPAAGRQAAEEHATSVSPHSTFLFSFMTLLEKGVCDYVTVGTIHLMGLGW